MLQERIGAVVILAVVGAHAAAAVDAVGAGARVGERIEVVAVADEDERLAAVLHLLEILDEVVGRRERDVGAIADFARPLRALRPFDDVRRLQAVAGDLLHHLVEPLQIVVDVDLDGRRAGGDDAPHVAFVEQVRLDLLEQLADAAGVAEVEMQIVDEEQHDAPGRVVRRTRRRQDDAFLRRRRRRRRDVEDASAVDQREGHEFLLHAVFEDLELFLLEVGDEQAAVIPGDDVHGDDVDARREIGTCLLVLDRRLTSGLPRLPGGRLVRRGGVWRGGGAGVRASVAPTCASPRSPPATR